ncbi:hypothetical protein SAY86_012743 [Trapa natans]|uniref:NmrA-like domain-containing protein n=1 Tax=Trapa natans TaxID=22666 RepID=A0AAN7R7I6_TRANT|nr:hypothetical protein SAY86_012743 [Trapa natans]
MSAEDMVKSRIMIIGATGNLGHHLATAALRSSHPTFALVRPSSFSDAVKSRTLATLSDAGLVIIKGSLEDEASLLEALRRVDVVICALPAKQALDQKLLIQAIKKVGSIKKFIPSEFGSDPDKAHVSSMSYGFYTRKSEIRRVIEAEAIPYTIISCNFYMSYLLHSLVQPGLMVPPRDEVTVFGNGNIRGVFVKESDVAAFTINAVDDPRTLNKVVYLRPPGNVYSMNELIEIWESKIGNKLKKKYKSEEELLAKIKETPYPDNMPFIFIYSTFIKGDQTYFEIEESGGLDGLTLYPNLAYTTISEYLDTLV